MSAALWIVLAACLAYFVRRWFKRHAIEVRPAEAHAEPVRPGLVEQFRIASAALQHAHDVQAVESYCLSWSDGTGPKARAVLAMSLGKLLGDSGVLARQLDVAFESLAIIEKAKNEETLLNRLSVARHALHQACAEAPHAFTPQHCARLIAVADEAASGRLADLAVAKVEALKAKAAAAKTEATRGKHLAAAKAYATEAARHPNISTPDRVRIRAQVTA